MRRNGISNLEVVTVQEQPQIHQIVKCQYRTSVSTANPGVQFSGGMILQMPYFLPSGAILRMYSMGSRNSSSVGLKVGASCNPCGLILLFVSRWAKGWPRLSTLDMSKGGARRTLSGMWLA